MHERLLALGKSVLAERDLDRMLTVAIDGLIELCGAERGMVLLINAEGKMVFEVGRNLEQEDLDRPELEVSRGILEKVRAEERPFWHPNVLDDPSLGRRESVLRLSILSVICQPIRDLGRTLGLIYLDNRGAQGEFTEETARQVESFSELVALAARNALERRHLTRHIGLLSKGLQTRFDFNAIIGRDPKMIEVLKQVTQVADSDATVLVQGESGTGKELVARAIHLNSRRREKPFIPVNCGALPEALLESELFGHVRGAFTGAVRDHPGWFERAEGGTLLLDEVGELPPSLQVKLLRVLENREYSPVGSTQIRHTTARIVAATHRDLEAMAREGRMRQDFLYRLNVFEIRVPSLRERRSDLPLLIRRLIDQHAGRRGPKRLAPDAERLLLAYDYPGNIRELQNFLQRAMLMSDGEEVIEAQHLPEALRNLPPPVLPSEIEEEAPPPGECFRTAKQRVVERFEHEYLCRCLHKTSGNISQAARLARIDYKNFYTKMQQYGIDAARYR
jgi:transcriptional regulator with GAF, ATPase, and Fis domain